MSQQSHGVLNGKMRLLDTIRDTLLEVVNTGMCRLG